MRRTRAWILIDTRIWVLALRAPLYEAGSRLAHLGSRSAEIVRDALARDVLLFSPQLVAEIHHVTTSRTRPRLPGAMARDYLWQILSRRNARYRPISRARLEEALALAAESGIHIWDYLVALPCKERLDRIVTMDPHYRHPHFGRLARVDNPLGLWASEGQPLA